jgi:protein required for attachment to host cells
MVRKLLYVVTDGGRARFVEQSPETGDFRTIETLDHMPELRQLREELLASPPPRAFESASPLRHGMGPEGHVRRSKEAFMAEVAGRAAETAGRLGLEGVVLAAPSRLMGALRDALAKGIVIAGTLDKDLTKVPDHELAAWLTGAAGFRPRSGES